MTGLQGGAVFAPRTTVSAAEAWRIGLVGTAVVTVANLVLWAVVQPLLGAELLVPESPGSDVLHEMTVLDVVVNTLPAGVLATLLLWLFTRGGRRGTGRWTILLIVLGVLSCGPALALDVSVGKQLGLLVFHAVALVGYLGTVRVLLSRREAAAPAAPAA